MKRTTQFKYILAASVALATFLIYLPSLHNDFINWDDDIYVLNNVHIRSMNAQFFKWIFFDFYAAYWSPLTWISHAVDYALWGLNPRGHHLTNNILHAVNSFVVVALVIKLLGIWKRFVSETAPQRLFSDRMVLVAAGATGLLFGLHPLHVESAVWVAERKDLLCALFFLLSITAYSSYAGRQNTGGNRDQPFSRFFETSYLLSIGSFLLALFSKPMAVSLPLVLLILDWHPFRRIHSSRTFRSALLEKLPFIILSLVGSILIFLAHRAQAAMASIGALPVSTRLLVASKSLVLYLVKIVWPVDLFPYYPYPTNVAFFSPGYFFAAVLVLGVTVACFIMAKTRRWCLATWGYYVVTLLPVLGIVQVGPQSMADRFMYLPSLGPFLLIGVIAARIDRKIGTLHRSGLVLKIAGAGLLLLTLSSLTYLQIGRWKNGITLWSYVIAKEPVRAFAAYNNRGVCYEKRGQLDLAAADYRETIALHPGDDQAYFNLGVVYHKAGFLDMARDSYDNSLAINPNRAEAYHNRGVIYSSQGQWEKALEDFDKAIDLDGGLGSAYFNRGTLYLKSGEPELAVPDFQKACEQGSREACAALQTARQHPRTTGIPDRTLSQ